MIERARRRVSAECPDAARAVEVRAPLRISFAGGGTDLPAYYERYGGLVVSAAISAGCRVEVRPAPTGRIVIDSADYGLTQVFRGGAKPPVKEPLALPKAALEYYAPTLGTRGVSLHLQADVPPGTGLGSSSAMAVALMRALAAFTGRPIDARTAAERACRLEIERLGMPIGRQDQYASAFGGLNAITFSAGGVCVRPLRIAPDIREGLDWRLLLFATGRTHNSGDILSQQRAATTRNGATIALLHELKALARQMETALIQGELDEVGRLLDEGWQRKRRPTGGVTSTAIDGWYAAAREAGALGGKITGAGGGGFLLLYCSPGRQPAVRAALSDLSELPFRLSARGARESIRQVAE